MTDNGNKEVSANEVYKIVVEKSFGTPSSIFANAHEEFLLSNLNKGIAKNKVSEQ